jgi:hypothetical protein
MPVILNLAFLKTDGILPAHGVMALRSNHGMGSGPAKNKSSLYGEQIISMTSQGRIYFTEIGA